MALIVLIVHLFIALGLVGLVLMQRSEGGALGMGGGSGSLISGRGAADILARMTTVAGAIFFLTSLSLTLMAGRDRGGGSVLERAPATAPVTAPAPLAPPEQPVEGALDGVPGPEDAVQRAGPLQERPPISTTSPASESAPETPAARAAAVPPPAAEPQPTRTAAAPAPTRPQASAAPPRQAATPPPLTAAEPSPAPTNSTPPATPAAESVEDAPAEPAPSPRVRAGPEE